MPPKYAVNKDSPTYSGLLKRDNPPLGMLPEPLRREGATSEFTILIKRESILIKRESVSGVALMYVVNTGTRVTAVPGTA